MFRSFELSRPYTFVFELCRNLQRTQMVKRLVNIVGQSIPAVGLFSGENFGSG